jgi:hypothetical protein
MGFIGLKYYFRCWRKLTQGFRLAKKNNSSILLVFALVYGVTSTGTYPNDAPADAPCRRTQIRRHPVKLFFFASLIQGGRVINLNRPFSKEVLVFHFRQFNFQMG